MDELELLRTEVNPRDLCGNAVGKKPYWMGEYQYDQCYCILDNNHDGECKCEHTIGDDND